MAPLLEDPRIRQTWNNISHNAETVTETAATGVWQFLHNYINPCFISIGAGFNQCTTQCFPEREERARRLRERERTRGRAEYSFDFYDDWDDDQTDSNGGLLGWGNDELDRLLAGSGSHGHAVDGQPSGKKRKMSYGTRRLQKRKGTLDGLPDPTIIPSTSALGFLQRLPFKIGGTLRYKPSAADLQDHPGVHRSELADDAEVEPLIDDEHSDHSEHGDLDVIKTRGRSSTTGSGDTSDSFRSRGDLFPSDGEDDAVPLSDEFAITLGRRNTLTGLDDRSSAKTRRSSKGKALDGTRPISRTISRASYRSSTQSLHGLNSVHENYTEIPDTTHPLSSQMKGGNIPSASDLKEEEERMQKEEEEELRAKREAAAYLATQRGLSTGQVATFGDQTWDPAPLSAVGNVPKAGSQEDQDVPLAEAGSSKITEGSIEDITHSESAVPAQDAAVPIETVFVPARLPNF